jgi:hypothetical protein
LLIGETPEVLGKDRLGGELCAGRGFGVDVAARERLTLEQVGHAPERSD